MDNETDVQNENNGTTHVRGNTVGTPEESQWAVLVYLALLGCGGAANVVHALALLRTRRSGALSLILQIALVDTLLLYVAVSEVLLLNRNNWYFSPELCPVFKGTEVFINSLTIYLLVCFNFHVISVWNLHQNQVHKSGKNPLTSCNSSDDDSNECLVTKPENRIVTIDYRKRKDDVSVVIPTIFIWIVALSLSVPNFALSTTLRLKENYALCAVIDMFYGQVLQYSLLSFKVVLPVLLLLISLLILSVKLSKTSRSDIDNIVTRKTNDIRRLLIFGIALTLLYFLTSLQRHLLHFIHVFTHPFTRNTINNFKMPPLYNDSLSTSNMMYLSMLHYSGATLRGVLCLILLPKFPQLVRTKMCPCCKVAK